MQFKSPAKINLSLKVLKDIRSDGYHSIQTIMHTISLCDTVTINVLAGGATEDILTCNDPNIPLDCRNLVIKALDIFRQVSHSCSFFQIHLDKNIPVGAGLGGGSSNAATVIYAAKTLTGANVDNSQLQLIAESIGSDVPFFLATKTGTATCTGRGETVVDLAGRDDWFVLVTLPGVNCVTREVYKMFDECLTSEIPQDNDLEPAALAAYPQLRVIRVVLDVVDLKWQMTGSGSAFFANTRTSTEAKAVVTILQRLLPDSKAHAVQSLNKSLKGWFKC